MSNVTNKRKVHKDMRLDKEDRRSFTPPNVFPLLDQFGRLIHQDRRHIPDRRIANIEVTEIDSDFNDELFK